MSIQARVLAIIEKEGISRNQFSLKCGINAQTIHHIVTGRKTNPSYGVINKILLTYSYISPDWLLMGRGAMLRSEVAPPPAALSANLSTNKGIIGSGSIYYNAEQTQQIEALTQKIEELTTRNKELEKNNDRLLSQQEALMRQLERQSIQIDRFTLQIERLTESKE